MEERFTAIEARLQSLESSIKNPSSSPRFNRTLEDTFNHLSRKTDRALDDCQSLQFKVRELLLEMSYRAFADDVKQLQLECTGFGSRAHVEELEAALSAMPPAESLYKLLADQQQLEQRLSHEFVSRASAVHWVDQARKAALEVCAEQASREELKALSNKFMSKLAHSSQEVPNMQTKLRLLQEQHREKQEFLMKMLDAKAEKHELREVAEALATKTAEQAFNELREEYHAHAEEAETQLASFERSLAQQEAVVRRFDEILLQKCSKYDFQQLAEVVQRLGDYPQCEKKVKELTASVTDLWLRQQNYEAELAALKTAVTPMISFYSKKLDLDGQVKLLSDEMKRLSLYVGDKVDRREFYERLEEFATLESQQTLLEQVEECSQHLKLLVSQIGAMQKVVADPQRSQGLERIHREFLSKATKKLSDIILKPRVEETEGSKRFFRSQKMERTFLSRSGTQTPGRRLFVKSYERL